MPDGLSPNEPGNEGYEVIASDGCRLAGRIFGDAALPPVILAHPIGLDGRFWTRIVEQLAGGLRLIVPDVRGHGASTRGNGETTVEQLADDVVCILDALDIQVAGYVGCSLGSTIGMYLGANAADRITWVVLANAPARIPLPREAFERAINGARAGALPDMARGMIGNWLAAATTTSSTELVEELLSQMQGTDGNGFADAFAALRDSDRNADLGRIAVPALVVTGDADHAFPPDAANAMAGAIPHGRATVIAMAGHLAPVEQPHRFAEIIRSFAADRTGEDRRT